MTLGNQRGIRPQECNRNRDQFVVGGVGAEEPDDEEFPEEDFPNVDEEEFDEMVAAGAFENEEEKGDQEVEESHQVEAVEEDGNEGQDPSVKKAQIKPTKDEVEKHNLTYIPRRMWCKICAEAAIQEDPHRRNPDDHECEGIPEIHMDYKELRKGQRPFLVMRDRKAWATFGARCLKKGPDDTWMVRKCVERIDSWGMKEAKLMIRSDGENAIKALRKAIVEERQGGTTVGTSPPRDPQSNGVAERAVREFTGQLRRLKLGLEARLGIAISNDHPIVDWLAQHAGFVINKYLKGSQDGFTAHFRMFQREYKGELVEFGERVWAKTRTTGRRQDKKKENPLGARAMPGVWVGIHEETGEHLVRSKGVDPQSSESGP